MQFAGVIALALAFTCALVAASDLLPAGGAHFAIEGVSIIDAAVWVALPLAVGVIMGQMFRFAWVQKSQSVRFKAMLRSVTSSRDAVLSVLISPIVFFALLQTSKNSIETIQTLALSFENGFFINHVIAAILARGRAQYGPKDEKATNG